MILSWFIIILNNNIIIFFNHFTYADFLTISHYRNPQIAEVRLFIKVKLFSSVVCIFFFFFLTVSLSHHSTYLFPTRIPVGIVCLVHGRNVG